MDIPVLSTIARFFTRVTTGIEDFIDEWFIQPLDEFGETVRELQNALELLADTLPETDPELKTRVVRLYDVMEALRDYQRKELKTLLKRRYEFLWRTFKQVFTRSIVKNLILNLISLRWGQALTFILKQGLSITMAAVAAEETFKSLNNDLGPALIRKVLTNDNPRHYSNRRHQTRRIGG